MARLRLFCLPYAGGSASIFRDWRLYLPDWVEPVPLHVPGRGLRHGQPLLHDWPALIEVLLRDVEPFVDQPFAIFGHSMGGLIARELAQAIAARRRRLPAWLGVSGCIAPSRRQTELKWLDCPEAELLTELRSLNGTPPELLANRDLLDLLLPVLRADFHLCGSYRYLARPALRCPLLVLGGRDDEISHEIENLQAWAQEVTAPIRIQMFDGDHFFIDQRRAEVVDAVAKSLSQTVAWQGAAHA